MEPTVSLKEGVLRIFIAVKKSSPSAGFEPKNLGPNGKHTNTFVLSLPVASKWEVNPTGQSFLEKLTRSRKPDGSLANSQ
jgi:hypothetical protein